MQAEITLRQAAQQALEALERINAIHYLQDLYEALDWEIDALRAALAEPEQEPVAWLYRDAWGTMKLSQTLPPPVGAFPVYTAPTPHKPQTTHWEGCEAVHPECKEKNT